jgi:hypothetical protein
VKARAIASLALSWLALGAAALTATESSGFLEARWDTFETGNRSSELWLEANWTGRWQTSGWELACELSLLSDSGDAIAHDRSGRDAWFRLDDDALSRSRLRLDQFWLRWRPRQGNSPWFVQIGRLPIAWGVTDAIKPADAVMRFDWTDPLLERRLTPWAVRTVRRQLGYELELFASAQPSASRLPPQSGRWALGGSPTPEVASDLGPQFGARWTWRRERVEGTLQWLDGSEDRFVPVFVPPAVVIVRDQRARQMVGGAVWTYFGSVTARTEIETSRLHGTAERDYRRTTGALEFEWTTGRWRWIAGYARSWSSAAELDNQAGLDRALLPVTYLHVERGSITESKLSLEWIAGRDRQQLWRVEGSWPLPRDLRVTLRAESLSGDPESLLGRWQRNDRLTSVLRYSFSRSSQSMASSTNAPGT